MYEQFRRFFRHSAAYAFGGMVNRAFAILLVPLYTRFLTQDDYGELALLTAGVSILWLTFDFGISSAVTRFYYDYDDEARRRRYIGSMWLTLMVIGGGASLALTFAGSSVLSALFGHVAFWPYVGLIIWGTFLNTANIIPNALMRIREQSTRFVALVCAQSFLLLVLAIVFVVILRMELLGAVLALFFQALGIFLFFTVYVLANSSLRPDWGAIRRSLVFGIPLLILELGWWVLSASDRFLLRRYESAAVVAIYALGYALGRLLMMLSLSFDQAWTPFFFAAAKKDDAEARRLATYGATYFTLAVAAIGLLIAVFARGAVMVAGGSNYVEAARVTPLIVLGSVFQSMFYVPSRGLLLTKKTQVMPWVVAGSAAVNIGLNLLLIPRYGMMGAAVVMVLSFATATALTFWFSQRSYHIDYQKARIAKVLAVLTVAVVASTLLYAETWPLSFVWKAAVIVGAPLTLWLTGFFEAREIESVRRLIARRRAAGGKSP